MSEDEVRRRDYASLSDRFQPVRHLHCKYGRSRSLHLLRLVNAFTFYYCIVVSPMPSLSSSPFSLPSSVHTGAERVIVTRHTLYRYLRD